MKTGFLTWASLLGNAVLIWLLWFREAPPKLSGPALSPNQGAAAPVPTFPANEPVSTRVAKQQPPPKWPPFHWDDVASADYTNYVANLRRIGCPEETVARIVRGGTLTDLLRRLHAGAIPQHDLIYTVLAEGEEGFKKIEEAFEPIKVERKKRDDLLAALLGSTPPNTNMAIQVARERTDREFSYVDPERREKLEALAVENMDRYSRLQKSRSDYSPKEFREQRTLLNQELRSAQLEVLSGPEREEFERREWKENHGQEFGTLALIAESPEVLRAYAGLPPEQLAQVLGPEKTADLERIGEQREKDPRSTGATEDKAAEPWVVRGDFRSLWAVARRFGLSAEHPRAALDVIREYETTLKTVRADESLLPRERRQLLAALAAERDGRIEGILGTEAWQTYRFHFEDW